MTFECEPVEVIDEDGWSDWISPKMTGYLMQCCDCGLIHEIDFKVVKYIGERQTNGMQESVDVEDQDVQTLLRARRRDDLSSPQPSMTEQTNESP
jgi:Zn-finger protein